MTSDGECRVPAADVGHGGRGVDVATEDGIDGEAGERRAEQLRGDVAGEAQVVDAAEEPEGERHRRVDVRAGDVAEGEDRGHHDETEAETDADVLNAAVRSGVDGCSAGAAEDERERAERLGEVGRERVAVISRA